MPRQIAKILLILLCAAASLQCQSVSYYGQAINGHAEIMRSREPISDLIDNPDTPAQLRKKLIFVQSVREFAKSQLHLPVNDHYLSYVELNRPYVVWNVFAAPEFSLTPETWCFPVVGCVAYRGYFSEQDARRFGDSLKQEGFDVFIGGAIAYSTLGWFDDPVLSTFLNLSAPETAALIFHELAHSILYIQDDTAFNESFATAVEQEGLRRWQSSANDPKGYENWLLKRQWRQRFIGLVSKYRTKLQDLYQGNLPLPEKRNQKAFLFNQMRSEFLDLKSDYRAMAAYDAWFRKPLNNAQLISVSTYHNWVPAFHKILAASGGGLEEFYQRCRELAKKDKAERQRILEDYLDSNLAQGKKRIVSSKD
ncbi:MAG: aminopeptidase [Desulfobacterales bacterium]|jgi:predicted aminopeptidase